MRNITVVSDPGIDDLVALVLFYRLSPLSKNCLISTFGNAAENITARNAKEFIAFVAKSWDFMNGSKKPLNGKIEHSWPDYFHGEDGVWGVHPNVNIKNTKSLKDYPKNEEAISLSPMTDVLQLLKEGKLKKATIMGGAFNIEGNETKHAETNIAFDPDSACQFFEESKEVETRVVPLDVTRKVFWTIDSVRGIAETNKISNWLKELLLAWFDRYGHEREKNFNLHDPLAIYLTFYPEKAKWVQSGVNVVISGEQRGRTVMKKTNPPCQIALDLIDGPKISKEIYSLIFEGNK